MSARKTDIAGRLPIRRGLTEAEAALYVGVGATKFGELVREGLMPRPRVLGNLRRWDIDDLDAAFRGLPIEGDPANNGQPPNPWH